ncbi:hypothetical protein PB2503_01202 [Parvularcula bermudensis HTCC2503]|uniref:Thioredoxin domain-containing protein n=1 Tax=Parvularcula bermudensis (strain ATCC BAA-594 / HTCC2503 / KCTC 12087) TaxID=314260 RepID=E0TBB6_PARBH|nr:redoxin domain-containing protein [Parvularcula bermudensis]ADM08320.1 hypothetical protein PB2503_01202 [Parvularcula bermudensis HTCC2503]
MLLHPGRKAPSLDIPTLKGDHWSLDRRTPDAMTIILVYRGLHCPACKEQLEKLNKMIGRFADLGAEIFALSMDSRERAQQTAEEWAIDDVPLGYGLSAERATDWGLFLSTAIKEEEPAIFAEPGIFMIKPDGTLFAAYLQSVPFARPTLDDLLSGLEFVIDNDYPARGIER